MGVFINEAWADAATTTAAAPNGGLSQILVLLGFVVIFYLLLWRPQAKRAKEHRQLMESLAIGNEVSTTGGILGKIVEIKGEIVTLKIAENVDIKVQKAAIVNVFPKGTM
ncbi:preprotein translocase subunit YajC [Rickettsiella massiliensis]|uniref:preprotein translocase subunit YajC n=1 Tax=Rickettsiella massiliensis TaxID=676517 RepID=UPI00029A958B|nr:preprotein translocase subunit YajC [Rickettsiella massiliensis]